MMVSAQVSLTDAYFPIAGDTLRYSIADSTATVDLLSEGPARSWNFGNLEPAVNFSEAVSSATGDTIFPNADLRVRLDVFTVGYFRLSPTLYELVGIEGSLDIFPDLRFATPLAPPRPERRAPLTYQDGFTTQTNNTLVVSPDSLPAAVLSQFGDILGNVDSIRVTNTSTRQDTVDAFGTLTLNGQTFDVIRERRTEILNTTIEVLAGFLGYVEVTALVLASAPELANFLGEQPPMTTYYYWSPESKEAVAIVSTDTEGNADGITFKRFERTSSIGGPQLRQAEVKVYPNPAYGLTTFEVDDLSPGLYTLSIVNILGKRVSNTLFTAFGKRGKVEVDVSTLPFGTYLYSLTNERGRILTTKKMMVGR